MSGQVPESNPRTDYEVKKKVDDIKGKCNLRVSEEVVTKYMTSEGRFVSEDIESRMNKIDATIEILAQYNIPFRLLRYGRIVQEMPVLHCNKFSDYGFESSEELYSNIAFYILDHKMEIGIPAGNGIFFVRVPASLNAEIQLKEQLANSRRAVETQPVPSKLINTTVFKDRHRNTIFLLLCEKRFKMPSRTFENGIEFLTEGEIVVPTERIKIEEESRPAMLKEPEVLHSQTTYMLSVKNLFKGRADPDYSMLTKISDGIFFYRDEAGAVLAAIDNHAYDISAERVRDELLLQFFRRTGRHPKPGQIKVLLGAISRTVKYEGPTLTDAPFVREMQLSDKKTEFVQKLAEVIKMMYEQGTRVQMRALAEATGVDGAVLGRRMKDPSVMEGVRRATNIEYEVSRQAHKNISIIEMQKVNGVWQAEA